MSRVTLTDVSVSSSPHDVSRLLLEQRARWQRGERVSVEQLLDENPSLITNSDAVLDLIYHEMVLRSTAGDPPDRTQLVQRFPQYEDELVKMVQVHEVIEGDAVGLASTPASEQSSVTPTWSSLELDPSLPKIAGYQLLNVAGRGGMGIVYRARHLATNRIVALKVIRAGQFASPRDIDRFHKEASMTARLDHRHIVPIYDVGQDGDTHYYSMAFVDGASLAEVLKQDRPGPCETAELVAKVADALAYAHEQSITHRDIKPQNILLDRKGEPRLADFGLAKLQSGSVDFSTSTRLIGTPVYFSPEQAAARNADVGPASDIYSLGTILYQMLTGRLPFVNDHLIGLLRQITEDEPTLPRRLDPTIDKDLEVICLKCLSKQPAARYVSAGALADDLRRFLAGEPILARPIGAWRRTWNRLVRHRAVALLTAALAALIVALACVGFLGSAALRRQSHLALDSRVESLTMRTRAIQHSNRAGRHFETLDSIRLCAQLLTNAAESDENRLALRNEAIVSLGLVDLQRQATWSVPPARIGNHAQTLSIDPGGTHFAYVDKDGGIVVRELINGDVVHKVSRYSGVVRQIVLSTQSQTVAAVCEDSAGVQCYLWQPLASTNPRPILANAVSHCRIAYAPSETRLAVVDESGTVTIVDSAGEPRPVRTRLGLGRVDGCRFADDDNLLVWGGHELVLLDVVADCERHRLRHEERALILDAACCLNCRLLVSGTSDHAAYLWDIDYPHKPTAVLRGHQQAVWHVDIDRQGSFITTSSGDGTTRLWSSRGELVLSAPGRAVRMSRDGQSISGFGRDEVIAWDWHRPDNPRHLRHDSLEDQRVHEAAAGVCDPAREYLMTVDWKGLNFWGLDDQRLLKHFPFSDFIESLKVSADGNYLVLMFCDRIERRKMERAQTVTLAEAGVYRWAGQLPSEVSISHDGRYVALVRDQVLVWSGDADPVAINIEFPSGGGLCWHPRENVLATSSEDGLVIWEVTGPGTIRRLNRQLETREMMCPLRFDPSGRRIVVNTNNRLQLWSMDDGDRQDLMELNGTGLRPDTHVAFTREMFAVGWPNGEVRLFDRENGKCLLTLPAAAKPPWVGFDATGRTLYCSGLDYHCLIWDLQQVRSSLNQLKLDWK